MEGEFLDIGRSAFDFIDEIERLSTEAALVARVRTEFSKYGFSVWVITGLPVGGEGIKEKMLLSGWSAEWHQLYIGKDFVRDDPVAKQCFRSTGPFEWREARYDAEAWPAAKNVMGLAADFGMAHGFCVPIHTFEGFQAVISMGGAKVDATPHAKRALHLMSIYAHAKAVALAGVPKDPTPRLLTVREREILKWTAAGKTRWEISVILGVSQHTVEAHLKSIAAKLNTPNKVAAVVAALRHGEIAL